MNLRTESAFDAGPERLARQIQAGSCVLFLGAGVSSSSGGPTGQQLADELGAHFLSSSPGQFPLDRVAEYVEVNSSRRDLEEYLQKRLGSLAPVGALLEIPKYRWRAIFTVNFDALLEEAYRLVPGRVQELYAVYSDKDDISNVPPGHVEFYKLHGCLTLMRSAEGRLALTSDDYSHAVKTRGQLYARLADCLDESTILFCGFGRNDEDFREVSRRLKEAFVHPEDQRRTYALFPKYEEIDLRRWEREKVALLDFEADSFFEHLRTTIPEGERIISAGGFVGGEPPELLGTLGSSAAELVGLLQRNFDFIDVRINDREDNIEDFFKGAIPSWGTIAKRIPAKRDLEDEISQSLLVDDTLDHPRPYFFLLTAEAGSGKSTLLRTVAAELALTWGREVLFLRPSGTLDFFSLERLAQLTDRRIYVFVDSATARARELSEFLADTTRSHLKVSLIATARTNEWEDVASEFSYPSETRFELGLLSSSEIDRVLEALENTGNLGLLQGLNYEQRFRSFEALAQKQLLVALREATEGNLFDTIILDEFYGIPSDTGRSAYLAVSSLHWLGIPIRVELLRRLLGISFSDFQDSVFLPAKGVIVAYDSLDAPEGVYGARHPVIARIVFWNKLPSEQARLDYYRRLFHSLDLGFETDRYAFRHLTRGSSRELLECLPLYETRQEFFNLASEVDPNDAYVYQHQAMMALGMGEINDALKAIGEARRLHPNDSSIRDTYTRTLIARGREQPWATARMAFSEAESLLNTAISRQPNSPYAYRTFAELNQVLASKSDDEGERVAYLEKAYKATLQGIDSCDTKAMLLQVQGQLEQQVGTVEGARGAFERALGERPSSVVIRLIYSRLEEREGQTDKAIQILRDGLATGGNDAHLRDRLAALLIKYYPNEHDEVVGHLRAAVAIPSNDYMPRYRLACFLHQSEDYSEAYTHFEVLLELNIPPMERNSIRWSRVGSGSLRSFSGQVTGLRYDYGFIRSEFPRDIYFRRLSVGPAQRAQLRIGSRITFDLDFNLRGPIAENLQLMTN